jgi:hypothetical protein
MYRRRIYTLNLDVLSQLVEEARLRYVEVNRPHVVIHLTDPVRPSSIFPHSLIDQPTAASAPVQSASNLE